MLHDAMVVGQSNSIVHRNFTAADKRKRISALNFGLGDSTQGTIN